MAKLDDRDDAVKTLHRTIAYLRSEAARLRLMEVALLLAHAEEVASAADHPGAGDARRPIRSRAPLVHH